MVLQPSWGPGAPSCCARLTVCSGLPSAAFGWRLDVTHSAADAICSRTGLRHQRQEERASTHLNRARRRLASPVSHHPLSPSPISPSHPSNIYRPCSCVSCQAAKLPSCQQSPFSLWPYQAPIPLPSVERSPLSVPPRRISGSTISVRVRPSFCLLSFS